MYRMILAVSAFAFVAACDSGMPRHDEAVAQGNSGEVGKVTIVEVASDGTKKGAVTVDKVVRTKDEWKERLTDEQYYVTREKGTERAFTGKYNKHNENGVYKCIGCGTPLFSSRTKYESGTGWPSFYEPVAEAEHRREAGPQLRHDPHRGVVQAMRLPPGARVYRRAAANGPAVLHEFRITGLRAREVDHGSRQVDHGSREVDHG